MASDGNNERPGTGRREDSFLARWSRRKHEAEHGAPPETNEPPGAPEEPDTQPRGSEAHAEDTGAAGAEPEPTDADLPHPDTLDRDSDFSVYLTRRVSSAFRRAAMRRLFSSPEFNVRDGLDDYDEDYTQFKSLGDTVTAHMRHHAERLREREREKAERENEAERARTARQDEPTPEPDHDTDGDENEQATTSDNPTAAGHAPADTRSARTPDNRDTDDTT